MSPCRLGGPLFGSDDHKIVSSQQWDFLCWWDVIFTLSRALESAILVIRTESCDVHYFLYVQLSLMLPNKFLSSESSEFWLAIVVGSKQGISNLSYSPEKCREIFSMFRQSDWRLLCHLGVTKNKTYPSPFSNVFANDLAWLSDMTSTGTSIANITVTS